MKIEDLQKEAKTLRKDIIEMIYRAKSGHPGGSLSIADILAVLYWKEMKVDPIQKWKTGIDWCLVKNMRLLHFIRH